MSVRILFIFAAVCALPSLHLRAQTAPVPHPAAERALERIVLERDFGDNLKFHSREVITIAENRKVQGLNGLMFLRWKGADSVTEVVASVQWFEETSDLMRFYGAEKARTDRRLLAIGDTVIWKTAEHSYLWTDGEHFMVGLGGSPPPKEMLEAWLALVDSNPPDLSRVPTASP